MKGEGLYLFLDNEDGDGDSNANDNVEKWMQGEGAYLRLWIMKMVMIIL